MLELTEKAVEALEDIRRNEGIPEGHSTRLAAEQRPSGDLAVRLEFVAEASAEDVVTEQAGTEVHVDPLIVEPLADSVMDVQQGDQGVGFVFRPRES